MTTTTTTTFAEVIDFLNREVVTALATGDFSKASMLVQIVGAIAPLDTTAAAPKVETA